MAKEYDVVLRLRSEAQEAIKGFDQTEKSLSDLSGLLSRVSKTLEQVQSEYDKVSVATEEAGKKATKAEKGRQKELQETINILKDLLTQLSKPIDATIKAGAESLAKEIIKNAKAATAQTEVESKKQIELNKAAIKIVAEKKSAETKKQSQIEIEAIKTVSEQRRRQNKIDSIEATELAKESVRAKIRLERQAQQEVQKAAKNAIAESIGKQFAGVNLSQAFDRITKEINSRGQVKSFGGIFTKMAGAYFPKTELRKIEQDMDKVRAHINSVNERIMDMRNAYAKAGAAGSDSARDQILALQKLKLQADATYQRLQKEAAAVGKKASTTDSQTIMSGAFGGIVKGAIIGRVVREIFDAITRLRYIYTDLVRMSLEWNVQLTNARIGMAAMISQGHDIYVNGEKIVNGVEKYNIALEKAREVQNQLLVVANRSIITFEELNENATAGMALLTARKIPLEKQAELLGLILSSEKAIGIQKQQQFMEMKQLLQGDIRRGELARQLVSLGKITKEELQKLSGTELYNKLTTVLAEMAVAGQAHMNTIQGKWEIMSDNMKFALAGIWDDPQVKAPIMAFLDDLTKRFFTLGKDEKGRAIMTMTEEGLQLVDALKSLSVAIVKVAKYLLDFANVGKIIEWTKWIAGAVSLAAVLSLLGTVVGGVKAAFTAFGIALTGGGGVFIAIIATIAALTTMRTIIGGITDSLGDYSAAVIEANGKTYDMTQNLAEVGREATANGKKIETLWKRYKELEGHTHNSKKEVQEFVNVSKELGKMVPTAVDGIDKMTGAYRLMGGEIDTTIVKLKTLEGQLIKVLIEQQQSELNVQKGLQERYLAVSQGSPEKFNQAVAVNWKQMIQTNPAMQGFLKEFQDYYAKDLKRGVLPGNLTNMFMLYAQERQAYNRRGLGNYSIEEDPAAIKYYGKDLSRRQAELEKTYLSRGYSKAEIAGAIEMSRFAMFQNKDMGVSALAVAGLSGIRKEFKDLKGDETALKNLDEKLSASVEKTVQYGAQLSAFPKDLVAAITDKLKKGEVIDLRGAAGGGGAGGAGGGGGAKEPKLAYTSEQLQAAGYQMDALIAKWGSFKAAVGQDELLKAMLSGYKEEAKYLDDALIDAEVRYNSFAEGSAEQKQAEEDINKIKEQQLRLEVQSKLEQESLLEGYAKANDLKMSDKATQQLINDLTEESGDSALKKLQTVAKINKLEVQRALLMSKEPDKKNADLHRQWAEDVAKIDRDLLEEKQVLANTEIQLDNNRVAKSKDNANKEAAHKRSVDEKTSEFKKKHLEESAERERRYVANIIENLNKYVATYQNVFDAETKNQELLNAQYEAGEISAQKRDEKIQKSQEIQQKALEKNIEKLQEEIEIDERRLQLYQEGSELWIDLNAAIARAKEKLMDLRIEQARLNAQIKITFDGWSNVMTALGGAFSKLGGFGETLGNILNDAGGLFKTLNDISGKTYKVNYTVDSMDNDTGVLKSITKTKDLHGIGGLFKSMFGKDASWGSFFSGLPDMIGLAQSGLSIAFGIASAIGKALEAAARHIYEGFQKRMSLLMDQYNNEELGLANAISSVQKERDATLKSLQGRKGEGKYSKEVIQQTAETLMQLYREQKKILKELDDTLANLNVAKNLRDVFKSFDEVIDNYKKYIDAGADVAKADEYRVESFANMVTDIQDQLDDAQESYNDSLQDEIDSWLEGAEDDWGRLISLEKKAQMDIEAAVKEYNEGLQERADERKDLEEELVQFIKDKEEEIQNIRNEGLLERRKTTEQDKLDRIADIQDEMDEKRAATNERLKELDEEDRKAKELLDQEISRINLRLQREREAHEERMEQIREEGEEEIANLREQLAYLELLLATWRSYYGEKVAESEKNAWQTKEATWWAEETSQPEITSGNPWWPMNYASIMGSVSSSMQAAGVPQAEIDAIMGQGSNWFNALKEWLTANKEKYFIYKDIDANGKEIWIVKSWASVTGTPTETTTTTTGATGGAGGGGGGATTSPTTSGQITRRGMGMDVDTTGLPQVAIGQSSAKWQSIIREWAGLNVIMGNAVPVGRQAATNIGAMNNVNVTVNLTGMEGMDKSALEQNIYSQVLSALDTAYRRTK